MNETVNKISSWNPEDFSSLINYLKNIWIDKNDVIVDWKYINKEWVCNFSVHNTKNIQEQSAFINALLSNKEFKGFYYYKWIRGNNHYFKINATKLGWVSVSDFVKNNNITRQAFWQNIHNYDVIKISTRKFLTKNK